MLELINRYSIKDILTFVILLAIAVKGIIAFWDMITAKIHKHDQKVIEKDDQEDELNNKINYIISSVDKIENNIDLLEGRFNSLQDTVDVLMNSDKDAIKAYITEKHHYFCYEVGAIDDFSLDCCEQRYAHYKEEKGNSFIDKLMEELRELPKISPQSISKK